MQGANFSTRGFFALAVPMILSRAGLAAMGVADGIMVARFQPQQFAWLSLAEGAMGRMLDVCVALLVGALAMVPRQFAQGDAAGARLLWRRTLPVALALGALGCTVGMLGPHWLPWLGQGAELTPGTLPLLKILGFGLPAGLLGLSAAIYLEGVGHPRYVAICVVTANFANLLLNWLLISGHGGFAAMGARGSVWSTTLVRVALAIALLGYAANLRHKTDPNRPAADLAQRAQSLNAQWRLAGTSAIMVATLVLLTGSLTVFAGWLGVLPLAAFAATWSLAAPGALVALGLADAAGIQVAAAAGTRGESGAASTAWMCLRVVVLTLSVLAILLAAAPQTFAAIYSTDLQLRASMIPLIPWVACILVADCIGFVMAAALRALREAAWPAVIEIGSMALLVPLAAGLALHQGYGVRGLFIAALAAGGLRSALLAVRLSLLTRSAQVREPRWTY